MSTVDKKTPVSISQSCPTAATRALSSPALYSLKKTAGSERTRLMAAASTGMVILLCTRVIKSVLVMSISKADRVTPRSNTVTGSSRPISPAGITRSKTSRVA
ncbi:MAG: hypothetical protein BWY65_01205 [Firmicutes bacterium ADurb.Bin373]|nr:MAG: hypothetical protein BWY65_01205 [Firmicutes bacterium ADurb.Bin373]